jgi:[acyl-carrier-protein] S-malonyltransferase
MSVPEGERGGLGFVFPGQGSQWVGMGGELGARWAAADRALAEADDVLGIPLRRLLREGPEDELRRTANCQPAVLAHAIAVLRVIESETGLVPDVVAGHSLGEITALVCAGALSFADALRLVRRRGLSMQQAVPEGRGSMAAITGLGLDAVEEACREAARGEVVAPSNVNAPDQIVVAGETAAVERAARRLASRGAAVEPLNVSAPFHCELMRPAADALRGDLDATPFVAPLLPVLSNVDATPHGDPPRIRELLLRQITSPVRWLDCVRAMRAAGVGTVLEIGSTGVLTRLLERSDAGVEGIAVGTPRQVEALLPRARGEVWAGTGYRVDLRRFSRRWRDDGWREQPNGVRRTGDGRRVELPTGVEWRFDDPAAHGL